MLGDKTNWVRNLHADNHAVLLQGTRENVSLVEDFSGNRAAILRRYLEISAGARPILSDRLPNATGRLRADRRRVSSVSGRPSCLRRRAVQRGGGAIVLVAMSN
jgi:hypothetical protein